MNESLTSNQLVTRLRNLRGGARLVAALAADEIERLQKRVDELDALAQGYYGQASEGWTKFRELERRVAHEPAAVCEHYYPRPETKQCQHCGETRIPQPPSAPLDMLSDMYKVYEALRQVGELNWPFDDDHHAVLNMIDEKYGRQMGDLLDDDGNPVTKSEPTEDPEPVGLALELIRTGLTATQYAEAKAALERGPGETNESLTVLPCGCELGRTADWVRRKCGCLPPLSENEVRK